MCRRDRRRGFYRENRIDFIYYYTSASDENRFGIRLRIRRLYPGAVNNLTPNEKVMFNYINDIV